MPWVSLTAQWNATSSHLICIEQPGSRCTNVNVGREPKVDRHTGDGDGEATEVGVQTERHLVG